MSIAAPTFVYDGDCAFCTTCARFLERYVPGPANVVPYQFADLAALGLTREQCEQAVQWADPDGTVAAGPDAIARLLSASSARLWAVPGALLRAAPVRAAAWPAYRWVARHRHRMPGGTAACAVPPRPEPSAYPEAGDRPEAG